MAVTSLGFNVFSTYNGAGLNRAQRALRDMNSTVRTNNKVSAAATRVTRTLSTAQNVLGRAVRRAASGMNMNARATRLATVASTGLRRAVVGATSALSANGRVTRLAAAAHRMLSRDVGRSSASHRTNASATRASSSATSALTSRVRTLRSAMMSSSSATRAHSAAARSASAATSGLASRMRTLGAASNVGSAGTRRLGNSMNYTGNRSRFLRVAVMGTAVALSGLGHAALGAVGAFAVMATSAGLAGGIFVGVMGAAARRAQQLKAAGGQLNAAQAGWIGATNRLTAAWNRFLDRTSGQTLRPAIVVVNALRVGISRLTPIINAVAPIAMRVARAFARWVVADNGLKRLVGTIVKFGVPALNHLVNAGRHMLAVLGFAFRALAPLGVRLAAAMERGARALRSWAAGGGFQRFVALIRANGPAISAFFRALGAAVRNVLVSLGPLGPIMLRISTLGLRVISSMPPWMIQAIAVAWMIARIRMLGVLRVLVLLGIRFLVARAVMLGYAFATRIAAAAQLLLRGRLLGTLLMMSLYRIAVVAITIATRAWAIATRIWAAAQMAANLAMRLSPIGLLVLLIAGLVAAIVWLATRTRFFQTVWRVTWMAVRSVALAVWGFIRAWWRITINFLLIVWRAVGGALRVAWNAVWRGMSIAARAIWNGLRVAWNAVKNFFVRVARVLGAGVLIAWRALWRIARTVGLVVWRGLRAAWNAVKNFFVRVARILGTGVLIAWRALWRIARAVGLAVWRFIRAAWNAVKNFFIRVARVLGTGVLIAWRALWRLARAVGLAVWRFIRAAWNAVKNFFIRVARVLGAGVLVAWRALWRILRAVGLAVWRFIRAAWNAAKNFFIRVARALRVGVLAIWRAAWRVVSNVGRAVWDFLKRAWNNTKNFFVRIGRILWAQLRLMFLQGSRWLRNTFWNPVRNFFTRTIPNAFRAAVRFIGRAWNLLKSIVSKPVKAVIDVVYNNGIVKLWNTVAGAFGAPKLKKFDFKGFKQGGYTGDGRPNDIAGVVHGQEYVIPAKQLKKMGGPQAAASMARGDYTTSMHGIKTAKSGGWGRGGMMPERYEKTFSKPVGGSGGGPITDGIGDDFFGNIGDFFKSIGGTLASAFGLSGYTTSVLKELGGLALGTIAPVANPLIQKAADFGKSVVRGIIPGAPGLEQLIAGKPGRDKAKGKSEGGVGKQGLIQTVADLIKDWITANDAIAGCGFTEFRKWRAGDGARVGPSDRRTMQMFALAQKLCKCKMSITQGSWSNASASAGTHSGGGALDIAQTSNKVVGALRSAGFAAWARGPKFGSPSFSPHTHAIAVGNRNLSPGAAQQVRDFKAGKNGLAGGGKDNFKDSSCSGGKAGNCKSYEGMALKAMRANGISTSQLGRFMSLMKKESSCNPRAQNNTDSNARAGIASRGLMQVIPPTFRANHCPGTSNNIFDPYANICAAARYIKRRYGGRVPGSPYRSGTGSASAGWHMVGESGPELVRFNGGETVRSHSRSKRMLASAESGDTKVKAERVGNEYHVHINGPVYAKSGQDFENMLAGALQNLKRKRRLPK